MCLEEKRGGGEACGYKGSEPEGGVENQAESRLGLFLFPK